MRISSLTFMKQLFLSCDEYSIGKKDEKIRQERLRTNYKTESENGYKDLYLYNYIKGVTLRVKDVTPLKCAEIRFSASRGIPIDDYYAELCALFPAQFSRSYDPWTQMEEIVQAVEDNRPVNDDVNKVSIMYCWQFAIDGKVIFGRTWEEFLKLIELIHNKTDLQTRMLVYVHNLAFEFQFIRCLLNWHKVFSIAPRKPIYAITNYGIEFRCSYVLTNYALSKLGEQLHTYKIEKLKTLDYKLERTPATPMTWDEIRYCINDVLVVSAYIQEQVTKERYISYIPLTATGYCRRYARKMCLYGTDKSKRNEQFKKYRGLMDTLQIQSVDEYKQLKRAFSGGFTHASAYYSGQICYDVDSIDFTSSYPFVCLSSANFPMSSAMEVIPESRAQFEHYLKYYWCMFDVEFIGIYPTFLNENYISASHCFTKEKAVTNNGRIVSADRIRLTITHIDFDIIRRTYKWAHMTVKNMRIYQKGYLPKELILAIIKLYQDKTRLKGVKGKEQEYQNGKSLLNSVYGMMVTDISKDDIIYTDVWDTKEADIEKDLKKYNNSPKRFLYYPWGVHIVKEATFNLWNGILHFCSKNDMGESCNDYIYSDTDSIKCFNKDKHMDFINAYNEQCKKKLKLMCKRLDIDYKELEPETIKGEKKPIGVYDPDGHYEKFKTLGAKRYMVQEDGKVNITVSGVNKRVAVPYLVEKYGKGIFDAFNMGLAIPAGYTGKLTHVYIDSFQSGVIVDYMGKEWKYSEQPPAVYLEDTAYYFDIASDYIDYIKGVQYVR